MTSPVMAREVGGQEEAGLAHVFLDDVARRGARSSMVARMVLNPEMPEDARVFKGPALMALTRMPRSPRSMASARWLPAALATPMTL